MGVGVVCGHMGAGMASVLEDVDAEGRQGVYACACMYVCELVCGCGCVGVGMWV